MKDRVSSATEDTIVALSTPMGKGALAVIRVSGKKAFEAIVPYFQVKSKKGRNSGVSFPDAMDSKKGIEESRDRELKLLRNKKRHFGIIVDDGRVVDEVVLSVFPAPHSYTGEDVLEISCHCNPFIVREIIQLILKEARLAEPGEFTQRAFFNNRLDLTEAEAVGDLLNAQTEVAHRAAVSQLEGSLYKKISHCLKRLTSYRIELELEIDFTEQDLPEIDLKVLLENLKSLRKDLQLLLATGREGMIIRDGLQVCLVGAPNVGKSSIFNRLLESERAIVTAIPGTTRDYLEEGLSINGYLVKLFDTAGLRPDTGEVESIGISRTYELIGQAERIIYIEDGEGRGLDKEIEQKITTREPSAKPEERIIRVINKADILKPEKIGEYSKKGFIPCSAKTGEGIDNLKERITADMELSCKMIESGILSNVRQIDAVAKSIKGIDNAINSLEMNLGYEFTAFDLKEASESLEEIIGKISNEEMLNKIFADFCIGK